MCTPAKRKQLEGKFKQLDSNGDGTLDLNELRDLLQKGNPNFKDNEVEQLYKACDQNGDGVIQFQEFLDYIYGKDHSEHAQGRTGQGRHDRMAASSGVGDDGTEGDWEACKAVFTAYAGPDMDNREFAKFCKDNHLVGHGLAKTDVDLIWTKVVPKGKRRIDFTMFQGACRHIAAKRKQTNGEIMELVAKSGGPVLTGTKQDAVRFYDDKSTFTGAHAHNDNFEGTDANAHVGRHDRQVAAEAAGLHAGDNTEDDWSKCQGLFDAFAGPGGELDGREFLKLCNDCGLIDRGFTKQDVDVTFTIVARKAKKIGFDVFQDAVRKIAQKKSKAISEIQGKIASSDGPQKTGTTKTEAVKFYDDKSQYTGAAADVFGREGHNDGRHEKLAAEQAAREAGGEDEHDWAEAMVTFAKYGGDDGVDSREFNKMCDDIGLFDKKFTHQDVDTVFVQAAGSKAVRKLDGEKFQKACRLIASKKGCPIHQVQSAIAASEGPKLRGTEAEYSRFHDDKDTYTGAHVGK